jgi:hypothetical protein
MATTMREASVTETAPISPGALRYAREQNRLSQRELGRRVARRLGRAEAARAIQVRLSRIEKGDEISEEDRELVDALAAELALGEEDLAIPPRWTWFKTQEGGLAFVALGMRQLAFSSPEKAYQARDALAIETEGSAQPFRGALLYPIHGQAITNTTLDANFGPSLSDHEREFLVALDPNLDDMNFLWTLQVVFEAKVSDAFENLADRAARFALEHAEFEGELALLHSLALRRLQHAPPEGAHLLDSWRREEQALFAILDRIHKARRERRAVVLREPEG